MLRITAIRLFRQASNNTSLSSRPDISAGQVFIMGPPLPVKRSRLPVTKRNGQARIFRFARPRPIHSLSAVPGRRQPRLGAVRHGLLATTDL